MWRSVCRGVRRGLQGCRLHASRGGEVVMATVKPLYARIADGEYDKQRTLTGEDTIHLPYSNTFTTDGVEVFMLSEEVAYSAQLLAGKVAEVVPTDLSKLRLPYPDIAVEFSISPELAALRQKQNLEISGEQADKNSYEINAVGMYAHAHPEGATVVQMYWKFVATGIVEVCALAIVINTDSWFGTPVRKVTVNHPRYPEVSIPVGLIPSPTWMAALDDAAQKRFLKALNDKETFLKMAKEAIDEIPTTLFATLLLINCKSGITLTRVPARVAPSGYGKRMKRKHSSPPFTVLALSEIESVSTAGLVSRRADLSAHYVRGHFKARKSGIYWWNSFVRGSGALRKRQAYVVKE